VRLEGTLDAFSLPDIFQLLSFTKKTGTLHLRRADAGADRHGVVHLREGAVTGARSDVARQGLGRRVVGAGLVDDESLEKAVATCTDDPGTGLAKALLDQGAVDADELRGLAAEHATDAVFDLLRWPDGEFAFVVDEADPDDSGATLSVEEIVAEGRRRLETWPELTAAVPAPDAVVSVVASPGTEPVLTRDEWGLLATVDGRRTVADLVVLSGKGEFAVVSALAGLAARGLVALDGGDDATARRQELLARLEGLPAPVASAPPAPPAPAATAPAPPAPRTAAPAADEVPAERKPVIPERPEPFTPTRQPDHAEEAPAYARAASSSVAASASVSSPSAPAATATVAGSGASVTQTAGATALAPETAPSSMIERDPSVNKSLLLRLIAGVRGL
jgi:hypothetical protein